MEELRYREAMEARRVIEEIREACNEDNKRRQSQ